MEDSTLHRFQTVVNVWHRTVEDDVRGIVYPIFAEHAVQRQGSAFAHRLHVISQRNRHSIVRLSVLRLIRFDVLLLFRGNDMLFVHNNRLKCKDTNYF